MAHVRHHVLCVEDTALTRAQSRPTLQPSAPPHTPPHGTTHPHAPVGTLLLCLAQAAAAAQDAKVASDAAAGRLAAAAADLEAAPGDDDEDGYLQDAQQAQLLDQLRGKVVVLQEQLVVLSQQMTRMAQASTPRCASRSQPSPQRAWLWRGSPLARRARCLCMCCRRGGPHALAPSYRTATARTSLPLSRQRMPRQTPPPTPQVAQDMRLQLAEQEAAAAQLRTAKEEAEAAAAQLEVSKEAAEAAVAQMRSQLASAQEQAAEARRQAEEVEDYKRRLVEVGWALAGPGGCPPACLAASRAARLSPASCQGPKGMPCSPPRPPAESPCPHAPSSLTNQPC